jgi:HAMP domain-containing protein
MRRHGRLARKYLVIMVSLVAGALLASGAIELYASYQENQAALVTLQREKAAGAASRIEGFVREIERQLAWTTQPLLVPPAAAIEQRRLDTVRLQRHVPAVTEVSHLDAVGREQLRVSRLAPDVIGGGTDYSTDPRFRVPRSGRTYFGPVYFRKESEPYMTIALAQSGGGVTVAEVNLKFIWDVVSQIRVGKAGVAYAVDAGGALIAHPDISLVLQKTSLAELAQVKSVLAAGVEPGPPIARDPRGRDVLTAHSVIAPLGWIVFVEQPVEEAFAPLRASAYRTAVLVALGIVLAAVAAAVLARRLARPIQALQTSAATVGAGALDHQITIRTGDELEALADEFNRMTARLRESYATLEQKVEDRTRELREALEQQTATAEILRAISQAHADVQPVFESIADSAVRLFRPWSTVVFQHQDGLVRLVAAGGGTPGSSPFRGQLQEPSRPTDENPPGRAMLTGIIQHVLDADTDPSWGPGLREGARARGFRSIIAVPMLRGRDVVGAIGVTRERAGGFTPTETTLLQTFADQAVIAIENARLVSELQARNADLTESLEQQTATAEILRVISSSPTDLQPVMETVAENAARVCGATDASIFRIEGEQLRRVVHFGSTIERTVPDTVPLRRDRPTGRAIIERRVIHIEDLQAVIDTEFPTLAAQVGASRVRTILAAPLVR